MTRTDFKPDSRTGRGDRSPASRVLVPSSSDHSTAEITTVALAVTADADGELLVTNVVSVPEQTPLDLPAEKREALREAVQKEVESVTEKASTTPVRGIIRIGRQWARIVAHTAADYDVTAIVTSHNSNRSSVVPFRRGSIERLQAWTDCRLVVTNNESSLADVSSILVPIAGGPHSRAALAVARALATYHDAWMDVLHVVEPDSDDGHRRVQQHFETAADQLGDFERWDTWKLEAEDVVNTIADQSTYYDATVLGAPRRSRLKQLLFGSTSEDISTTVDGAVLTVRSSQ